MKKSNNPKLQMHALRPVEMGDIKDLFEWNNHPLSRKNSLRSESITWEEHKRWFAERLADTLTTIYILCSDREKLGAVRFEEKENGVRISVVLNPDHIGKRLGSELIRRGTEKYMREKKPTHPIIAEIKGENLPSKRAFLGAGFKEDYTVYIFDTEVKPAE
jgi:UDP-2,4-diacetamido-2,4,6-trideoxy-beta-L-altropyranose hydrolase